MVKAQIVGVKTEADVDSYYFFCWGKGDTDRTQEYSSPIRVIKHPEHGLVYFAGGDCITEQIFQSYEDRIRLNEFWLDESKDYYYELNIYKNMSFWKRLKFLFKGEP